MTDKSHSRATLAARFRPLIEAELEQLRALTEAGNADRSPVELDQQSIGRVSRIDSLQVQAMAQASERRRTARRRQLQDALSRLETGEFGWCDECGEAIAVKRLEIDPAVTRCVDCVLS
ncbi:MAG TPA: molecular chaperone DnaK [Oceanicaulis sp.]|nr:TraR/DksA family transcriptional regulator [Synechococcus moorigangaii CMS01]HCY56702.1 molecular chaperone DnaK [Oceanicaulis sp.]